MRSWQSFLVERLLFLNKKQINTSTYMEQRRIANETPYVLPAKLKQNYNILINNSYSLDTYMLKSALHPDTRQILYLHGGGYIEQPLSWHWRFLDKLSQKLNGTITVPVYPKAPNHQYKEAFEKVLPIYEDLLTKTSPDNIVLMGDSAGGGFALALAQLLLEKGIPQPGNIILLSPWLDISLQNPKITAMEAKEPMLDVNLLIEVGKTFAGDTKTSNFLLSPINGPLQGLGKISLFVGTHELFLPDARKFKTLADKEKVFIHYHEYPKMNHVFPVFPIPEAKKAMQKMIEIIMD
ncbi:alpha/beta hydrolase fold domain-containing protein [Gorillibacterium timonense]|uniref:alpha/beta hydrolase fold domain-containing protein n=1 Tax=Gorillibacterium timonense TaxID=1689269 RepID=UPI00071E4922|nr:alpha/beta hydrolase [Gorillibacterium timonense]